ncbi:MAG: hypothetical protein LUI06_03710 [Ruminococcus sp.]|nr:hypothetical protein [Ruminococcus sp.]
MKPDNRVTESLIDQILEGNKVSHVKRAGYRWAFVAVPTALAVLCFAIFFVGNKDEQIQSDTDLEMQYAKSSEHYDYITPDVVDDEAEEEDAVDDEDDSISDENKLDSEYSEVIQSFIDSGENYRTFDTYGIDLVEATTNTVETLDGTVTFIVKAEYDESEEDFSPDCEVVIRNNTEKDIAISTAGIQGNYLDAQTILSIGSTLLYLEPGEEITDSIILANKVDNYDEFCVDFTDVEIIYIEDEAVYECSYFQLPYEWDESNGKEYSIVDTSFFGYDTDKSDYTFLIDDDEKIKKIDAWIEEVMQICDDYEITADDYPERGGIEGYIIKTNGDNEFGIYYISLISSDYDTTDEYEHENNFSFIDKKYDLPYEYIEQIQDIINEYEADTFTVYTSEDDPTKSDVTQLDVDSVTLNADFAEDGSYLSESRPDILLELDEVQKDAMMLALDTIEYNGKTYKYNNEVYASSKAENLIGTGTLNADGIQYSAYIYTIAGKDDKIGLDIEDWKLSIFELVE